MKPPKHGRSVRKPIQVYLSPEDRALLNELAAGHGISRAEVLRRGIRSYAVDHSGGRSPVLDLMNDLKGPDWPADVAASHDGYLADAYGAGCAMEDR